MKKLYHFFWDCGRDGDLTGVFVADEEDIKAAVGKQVYFGEVLGKHSEVYGPLEDGDLKVLSEDNEFIAKFERVVGATGYNPLDYIYDEEE